MRANRYLDYLKKCVSERDILESIDLTVMLTYHPEERIPGYSMFNKMGPFYKRVEKLGG